MVYRFFNKPVLLTTSVFASLANLTKAQVDLPTEKLAPLEIYADRLVQPSKFVSSNSAKTIRSEAGSIGNVTSQPHCHPSVFVHPATVSPGATMAQEGGFP